MILTENRDYFLKHHYSVELLMEYEHASSQAALNACNSHVRKFAALKLYIPRGPAKPNTRYSTLFPTCFLKGCI
jgi:hypothetical protein